MRLDLVHSVDSISEYFTQIYVANILFTIHSNGGDIHTECYEQITNVLNRLICILQHGIDNQYALS